MYVYEYYDSNHQYDKAFHTENDDTPLAYLALGLFPSSFSTSKRLENTMNKSWVHDLGL